MTLVNDLLSLVEKRKLIGMKREDLFSGGTIKKHRAKEKLIDNLLLKNFDNVELSSIRRFYVFTILRLKRKQSKLKYGEKILKDFIKDEKFTIALEVAQMLLVMSVFERKGHYQNICKELIKKINIEHDLIMSYVDALAGIKRIEQIKPVSYKSAFHFYFSNACYYETKDYHKTIEICKNGMEWIGEEYGQDNPAYNHLFLKSLLSTVYVGQNDDLINKYIQSQQKGTNNFFTGCQYKAVFWSYREDYNKSIEVCQSVLKLAKNRIIKELFSNVLAWNQLMINKPFKYYKFVNDINLLKKEKDSSKATIILLEALYLIKTESYQKAIKISYALQLYAYRYLSGRLERMFKIVIGYINNDFKIKDNRPINTIKKNNYLSIDLEVVPFHVIIDTILK